MSEKDQAEKCGQNQQLRVECALGVQQVRDEAMTCGDCGHRIGEECGHSGRQIYDGDLACDYFCNP